MTKTRLQHEVEKWFSDRLPEGWFIGPPEVVVDADEILIVGPRPERPDEAAGDAIAAWREETRQQRIELAAEAERTFRRRVSWGVALGGKRHLFTSQSVPVMTRLRIEERAVLDTLIGSGVARSRSDALAWCVRLVKRHQGDWLKDLDDALAVVRNVRVEGPTVV